MNSIQVVSVRHHAIEQLSVNQNSRTFLPYSIIQLLHNTSYDQQLIRTLSIRIVQETEVLPPLLQLRVRWVSPCVQQKKVKNKRCFAAAQCRMVEVVVVVSPNNAMKPSAVAESQQVEIMLLFEVTSNGIHLSFLKIPTISSIERCVSYYCWKVYVIYSYTNKFEM